MKIGFLIKTSPEKQDGFTVIRIAAALLDLGDEVSIFFVDDGVYHLVSSNPKSAGFKDLAARGCKISLCFQTARERGLKAEDIITGADRSSLYSLSQITANSDRFLSF